MIGRKNMKKILSVLLAALMVFSSMTVLVSAAPAVTPSAGVANHAGVNAGQIFYQQDFNAAALAELSDANLAQTLGWTVPGDTNHLSIEDGKLRIQTSKAGGETYVTPLVQNEAIAGNAITIEYKFKYEANCETPTSYLSVNFRKDENNALLATPVKTDGNVDTGTMTVIGGAAASSGLAVLDGYEPENFAGQEHTMRCVVDPGADGVIIHIDGRPVTYLGYNERSTWRSSTADQLIHDTMELMVQPGLDLILDDLCISEYAAALQITEVMANAGNLGAYQYLEIHNPNNAPVNLYDFCVVVFNACIGSGVTAGTIGNETNYSKGDKYTFSVDGNGNHIAKVEKDYSAWEPDGASTVLYFQPDAMRIMVDPKSMDPGKRYQTFDNPSYENGTLAAGETALVLLPYTLAKEGRSVTDESFREYLAGMSVPETTKIFACNNGISCGCEDQQHTDIDACPNPTQYSSKLLNVINESCQVALMKVDNVSTTGGYEPVGIGYGAPNAQQYSYYENYVVLTSKGITSGSTIAGFTTRTQYKNIPNPNVPLNVPIYLYNEKGEPIMEGGAHKFVIYNDSDNKPPIISEWNVPTYVFGTAASAFAATGDRSFEITYNQYGDETRAQKMGYMYYNASAPRPGLGKAEMCHSPGYVPPKCRDAFYVEATQDFDGSTKQVIAYVGADYIPEDENNEGYQLTGVSVGDSADILEKVPGALVKPDGSLKITLHYQRLYPKLVGYQETTAANHVYSLRLLGVTNHVKCQSLGFRIKLEWSDAAGYHVKEYDKNVQYVYDAVNWFDGTGAPKVITAAELGGSKLFAYELEGIPETQSDIKVTVTPYYIKGSADQAKRLAADETMVFVIHDLPTFTPGNADTNREEVDFGDDNSQPEPTP